MGVNTVVFIELTNRARTYINVKTTNHTAYELADVIYAQDVCGIHVSGCA